MHPGDAMAQTKGAWPGQSSESVAIFLVFDIPYEIKSGHSLFGFARCACSACRNSQLLKVQLSFMLFLGLAYDPVHVSPKPRWRRRRRIKFHRGVEIQL